jgi:lysophospholipase L1-like esterase
MKLHLLFLLLSLVIYTTSKGQNASSIWNDEISQITSNDDQITLQKGLIVFTGSSTIKGWKSLKEDFTGQQILNRGFGGSELSDVVYHFNKVIAKYKPSKVIVYSGDNDIANGKNSEQVFEEFQKLVKLMDKQLPKTELIIFSIKPSLARWDKYGEMKKANHLIKEFAQKKKKVKFVNIEEAMLGKDGKPIADYFESDGLHLNEEGYRVWSEVLKPYISGK